MAEVGKPVLVDHSVVEKDGSHASISETDPQKRELSRDLKSRHMQMIAIGGAIGAGLFVGSGSAFVRGGPGSVVICFALIGALMWFVMQALAELGVLYPVNGAFFSYNVRFMSPAWGMATGWDYSLQWLSILPFEITAAGLTLQFWEGARDVNIGVWVTVFLVGLVAIQFFGVRGYGEVEFVLSMIKITALTGFIILAIIINVGGVPTDDRGYIGGRYWENGAVFKNGFKGFCSVFVTASFAFGGTEMVGLAAAECANPVKIIPKATKQVLWRIAFFYIVSLLLVGLIIDSNDPRLLSAGNDNTKYSPFVLAITNAGIPGLPSVMNIVITASVISVANSCAFGSTRTLHALAGKGMAPKFFRFVDKHGRPIPCVVLQLLFGLLAYISIAPNAGVQLFNWLLAISGLANFFIWGSICIAHIRFRAGWKAQGHSLDELPYKSQGGIVGSYIGAIMCGLCLIASLYVSISPVGGGATAESFFQSYLAAPLILALYFGWKIYTREGKWYIRAHEMDITTGIRANLAELREEREEMLRKRAAMPAWKRKLTGFTSALF